MKQVMLFLTMMAMSATAFAWNHKQAPVDPDCAKMADVARGFAQLKAGGVATTPDALAAFIVQPKVQSYPIRSVVQYVFEQDGKTPAQIYQDLYGRCVLMGYKDLYGYFQDREAVDILKAQLAASQKQVQDLQTTLQSNRQVFSDELKTLEHLLARHGVHRIMLPESVIKASQQQ
jgi:hypothetical protein